MFCKKAWNCWNGFFFLRATVNSGATPQQLQLTVNSKRGQTLGSFCVCNTTHTHTHTRSVQSPVGIAVSLPLLPLLTSVTSQAGKTHTPTDATQKENTTEETREGEICSPHHSNTHTHTHRREILKQWASHVSLASWPYWQQHWHWAGRRRWWAWWWRWPRGSSPGSARRPCCACRSCPPGAGCSGQSPPGSPCGSTTAPGGGVNGGGTFKRSHKGSRAGRVLQLCSFDWILSPLICLP